MALLTTTTAASACDGPGPLTSGEVRWRWRHGTILEAHEVADGVDVVVACPPPHATTARFRIVTREVRIWERRDPLGARDPIEFAGWRRCEEQYEREHPTAKDE